VDVLISPLFCSPQEQYISYVAYPGISSSWSQEISIGKPGKFSGAQKVYLQPRKGIYKNI
jgi:hypothetical protein